MTSVPALSGSALRRNGCPRLMEFPPRWRWKILRRRSRPLKNTTSLSSLDRWNCPRATWRPFAIPTGTRSPCTGGKAVEVRKRVVRCDSWVEELSYFGLHTLVHLDERRPLAFVAFAGQLFCGVDAEFG